MQSNCIACIALATREHSDSVESYFVTTGTKFPGHAASPLCGLKPHKGLPMYSLGVHPQAISANESTTFECSLLCAVLI